MKFWGYDTKSKTMLECILTSISFEYSSENGSLTNVRIVGTPYTEENDAIFEKVFDKIYKDKNGNVQIHVKDLMRQLRLTFKNQDERSDWKIDTCRAESLYFVKGNSCNAEVWFLENGVIRRSVNWVIQKLDVTHNDIAFMTIKVADSDIIPKNYYPSKEMCICFEKVKAIDLDGNESVIGGYAEEVKLNTEDMNLLLDLQSILEKINNRNISIIYDESTGKYIAGKGQITSVYSPDLDAEYMKEHNEVIITEDCLIELPISINRSYKSYDDELVLSRK